LQAHHGKLDAGLGIFALLGTPSVQSIHDYYPFAIENGGRLAPTMAGELVDRPVFWWLFVASLAWVLPTLALCVVTIISVCNMSFGELLMFFFGVSGVMCDVNLCNVFLLLFMVLWLPISATLCRRALQTMWHAFMFLGLRFFPLFFFLLGGLCCFFLYEFD
jgi:hypothetical protein